MAAVAELLSSYEPFFIPQPGPQVALCTYPGEHLVYGGARGGGKTACALGFAGLHCQTYGLAARAILFRRSLPELEEVERLAYGMFPKAGAYYKSGKRTWYFPGGGTLKLRYLERTEHASRYQGHSYSLVIFEELTQWANSDGIDQISACVRGVEPNVQRKFIATCNPGGPGHTWVKDRYKLPDSAYKPFKTPIGNTEVEVVFIPAKLDDNPKLLLNDPGYVDRIKASGPLWLVQAWLAGDWNIVPGAFLEGIWQPDRHVVNPFPIPKSWRRWRAMDWGYNAPFSVGWYAQDMEGVIYRYRELYGWGGKANKGAKKPAKEVARLIKTAEATETTQGVKFQRNPADHDLWVQRGEERTIMTAFADEKLNWVQAHKGPASRVNGAQEIITRLNDDDFKVFRTCKHWLRTVPSMVPDEDNLEDVDTDQEDHCWDETRYSLVSRQPKTRKPEKPSKRPAPDTFDFVLSEAHLKDRMRSLIERYEALVGKRH